MIGILLASVITFGAVGDGVHDDRPAIQAALNASEVDGDTVFLPPGTYRVTRAGTAYHALEVDGVQMFGDNATIKLASGSAAGVRLLRVTGDSPVLEDLTLDGNRANQTVSEQRHGVFVTESSGLVIRRVTARDFTGDGFCIYTDAADTEIVDVLATLNTRNGLTFNARSTRTLVHRSRFAGNEAQQIDSEPGADHVVSDMRIEGNYIEASAGNYALTVSGTQTAYPAQRWRITGNEIHGAIFVVWARDVVIAGNRGTNTTAKATVTVQRSSQNVAVVGNDWRLSQTTTPDIAAVLVQATSGSAPSGVLVAGNRLQVDHSGGYGVRIDGAIDTDVMGNELVGGAVAVRVRATVIDRPVERVSVLGNRATGYTRAGVEVHGPGTVQRLDFERNTFTGTGPLLSLATDASITTIAP